MSRSVSSEIRKSDGNVNDQLNSIDWNFSNSETRNALHRIHPYPAKFIPEIPRNLITLFHPGDNSSVLDPFCGSGTTLAESIAAGLPSIGVDLNPLATLIAKVKTSVLDGDFESISVDVIRLAKARVSATQVAIPDIPNLDHWFMPAVQVALSSLLLEIDAVESGGIRDALRIAFSSIVVRVSNQESDTRYAAIDKGVSQADVWLAFEKACVAMALALRRQGATNESEPRIINKDIALVEPNEIGHDVGLVVTSPPYPNAYEYWLYHKYRMYWLGMDPIKVKESEIGARAHFFKKNHHTEHDFERQMGQCFDLLSKVMRDGAYACFIVGRSIIHGREIDNEAILVRAAAAHGFTLAGLTQRVIAPSRKSFNLSHAKIRREGILVLRLGRQ